MRNSAVGKMWYYMCCTMFAWAKLVISIVNKNRMLYNFVFFLFSFYVY